MSPESVGRSNAPLRSLEAVSSSLRGAIKRLGAVSKSLPEGDRGAVAAVRAEFGEARRIIRDALAMRHFVGHILRCVGRMQRAIHRAPGLTGATVESLRDAAELAEELAGVLEGMTGGDA